MEIIDELETVRRGPYGGCAGYIDYSGNMDMAITIRTMVVNDGTITLQAGRGRRRRLVPEFEFEETINKARAVLQAIDLAREGTRLIQTMRLLMIDNYDSFTYNLVQYLGELGVDVEVVRNDAEDVERLLARRRTAVVISRPGRARRRAGVSLDVVRRFGEARIPVLGCLPGAPIDRRRLRRPDRAGAHHHARQDLAHDHDGRGRLRRTAAAFRGDPLPLAGDRESSCPDVLEITARTAGWRDHGRTASRAPGRGRAVPPRVDPDGRRASSCCRTSSRAARPRSGHEHSRRDRRPPRRR